MRLPLLVHVLAGALALLSGYVALSVAKGAALHRKTGMLFVYVMVVMSMTGLLISAAGGIAPAINIPTALLTFYLVITGMTSVGANRGWSRRIDVAAMVMAFAIGAGCLALAVISIANGGAQAGLAYPLVLFGMAAVVGGIGDRRVILDGALKGSQRLRRHLWRMCFALFLSSIAFYLGPNRLPEALRIPALRPAAVLVPIAAIVYWNWRLRPHQLTRTTVPPERAPSSLLRVPIKR
jgi:uncharacterized membrane protein